MLRDKLFRTVGAALLNARSPQVFSLASGTVSSSCPPERNDRENLR